MLHRPTPPFLPAALLLAVVLLETMLVGPTASAEESTSAGETAYFRKQGGVAATSRALPEDLGEGARQVWRTELPSGHSTPTIVGDRIFLTTFADDELATVALDRNSGEQLWRQVCPAKSIESFHGTGSPAAATVASNGEAVFAFFGSYGLLCYDLDGQLLWDKPLGPFQDEFGAASSPVFADGKVILNEDHDVDSFLIAIDAATGKTVWKTERPGFTRSYSTPAVWEVEGRKQVVVAGALALMAYDLDTGSIVWQVRGLSRLVDGTPVIADGHVFIASWSTGGDESSRISMEPFADALQTYDKNGDDRIAKEELTTGPVLARFFRIDLNQDGALDKKEWQSHARVFEQAQNAALAVRAGGRGDITDTHVAWTYRRGLPVVPSPLVYDGVMYLVKDGGMITALDAATGDLLYQGRSGVSSSYYASPIAADGKVYLASRSGVVTVLNAGREWQRLSSHDLGERITATPVVCDGGLYVRTEAALYRFERKSE